jgi:hypothetical protein
MMSNTDSLPDLAYCNYRFTSCPFITQLYLFFNAGHVCDNCKCIKCVVLRWVRTPHCDCKLPPPRQGLSLDDRIRKKRLQCRHEPNSVPIYPHYLCFCDHPEKKHTQLALTNRKRSASDYSDEDSDPFDFEYDSSVELDSPDTSDIDVYCFRDLRRI